MDIIYIIIRNKLFTAITWGTVLDGKTNVSFISLLYMDFLEICVVLSKNMHRTAKQWDLNRPVGVQYFRT